MNPMNETKKTRLRGLRALIEQVVDEGSKAVQRVHVATAGRTFAVLEAIPPIAAPAKVIHVVHDASLTSTYGMIRLVNHAVGRTLEVALDLTEAEADSEVEVEVEVEESPRTS